MRRNKPHSISPTEGSCELVLNENVEFRLVSRVKGIIEVDAGQDRKYVGLQERDQ